MTVKTSIIAGREALQINRMWTTVVYWYSLHEKKCWFQQNKEEKGMQKNPHWIWLILNLRVS